MSQLKSLRSGVAALAPIADRLAAAGDAGAMAILDQAAEELARHVTTIARLADLPMAAWSWRRRNLHVLYPAGAVALRLGGPPRPPLLPPLVVALLAAAQHLDWQTHPAWVERLAASIQAAPATDGIR